MIAKNSNEQKSPKPVVVVVDDNPVNLKLVESVLAETIKVIPIPDGSKALNFLEKKIPDLILLDIEMPGIDGFDIIRSIKKTESLKKLPVLFLTGKKESEFEVTGLGLGAVDYIHKPIVSAILLQRVNTHLELKKHRENLEDMVKQRTIALTEQMRLLETTQDVSLLCLAALAENRDPETGRHIYRTKLYVNVLAREACRRGLYSSVLTEDRVENFRKSAPLHDIGKVGISDSILLKEGPLSTEEFSMMKKHTLIGAAALEVAVAKLGADSFIKDAQQIAAMHHEKWDGTGYPCGLQGDQIALSARFMAIADVYDALRNKRPYKEPVSHTESVEIILNGRGSHFDPELIDVFKEIHQEFAHIAASE